MLEGPTAIAFVKGDAVTVAKALRDFARTNPKLVVKGGLLGEKVLDAKDTAALADVAPREVLLARLAGGMAAPMVQFAGLLQALPRNLAYGLKALIDQGGAAGAPVAEAAPAVEASAETPAEETPGDAAKEEVLETPLETAADDAAPVVEEVTPSESEAAETPAESTESEAE
jgi:large subunit ribosomal protein L10